MSKLSINQASKLFKVSRHTIYARIKKGDITKDSEGFVSAQDMVRLFGNKTDKKATEKAVIELLNNTEKTVQVSEQKLEQLKNSNEQLLEQQVEQLKAQIEQLEKQLDYVKANEAWLKQQLDQKLIEHKKHEKKGLLSKFFG
jgi:predicted RNase H-like nuclease (RuvC/YqgF family)